MATKAKPPILLSLQSVCKKHLFLPNLDKIPTHIKPEKLKDSLSYSFNSEGDMR